MTTHFSNKTVLVEIRAQYLLHIMSFLPKDLNFVNHSSYIGWKESKRLKQVIVDLELYLFEKNVMFYAVQKRVLPNAYRLFTGSFLFLTWLHI
ncbi:putative glucuronosyltransferase [Rosa chinensis]|uniref:Putative glucuronosyltransferase n=1 Tax=Rosa chinensis TaxID=74649 RepID=A0A2P6QU74_ROSCH|nr:putative glucuronosyltransferase [Rosa chinensis]